ncbi:MAG: lytic transglycosylase domain-containing protein [Rhodospirillales bacterium]|nr:lytic transglycosylase domain-containing protein [Rhodospirillales bacterium]
MRTVLVTLAVLLPIVFGTPTHAKEEPAPPMPPPVARADIALYADAFRAAARNNWSRAHRLAQRASDPLGATILRWWDYSSPGTRASFADIAQFIDERPDWPDQRLLQINAESAMAKGVSDADVLAWYRWRDPVSREGRLRYADALLGIGQEQHATALIRKAWVEGSFTARELRETYRRHRTHLRPEDHLARLDRLVWANHARAARRMYRYVDEGQQRLAEARLTLRAYAGGVDRAIARVPQSLRDDPGLVYERLRWRRKKGRDEDARALLRTYPQDLGPRPKLWWRERAVLARSALEDGLADEAYALAAEHGQTAASTYSDAEWLAGWIALRFLDDARGAFLHFERMHGAVTMPISRARAAYWAGLAADTSGDPEGADLWYGKAAAYPGTFYGQVAMTRIAAPDAPLIGAASGAAGAATLNGHALFGAIRFLTFLGRDYLVGSFYRRLSKLSRNEADHAMISAFALSVGQPEQAIRAAQQAARDGYVSIDRLFPLVKVPFAREDGALEHALVLALIRQESRFDRLARSGSGALGLMQLMPRTAKSVARKMDLSQSSKRLTSNRAHNVALGSRYLSDMIERFDGSYLLAVAAYNGGPRNVSRWIAANGDPRNDPDIDIIDWIEMIPLSETRNYVQRVLEGTQVYRWQLGRRPTASSLERDLARGMSQRTVDAHCARIGNGERSAHVDFRALCRFSRSEGVMPVDRPDRGADRRAGWRRRRFR